MNLPTMMASKKSVTKGDDGAHHEVDGGAKRRNANQRAIVNLLDDADGDEADSWYEDDDGDGADDDDRQSIHDPVDR